MRYVRGCWRPRHVVGAVAVRGVARRNGATCTPPSAKGNSSIEPHISAASSTSKSSRMAEGGTCALGRCTVRPSRPTMKRLKFQPM